MKKTYDTIAFLAALAALLVGIYSLTQSRNTEPAATLPFDTSKLECWCGEPQGTVRMIGAWWYNYEPSSDIYVLEDETGELWCVRYNEGTIAENDFLLLWIADNGTPDNIEDDVVSKVWIEAHD